MSEEITVKKGKPISAAEAQALDRSKMGVGTLTRASGEVEGQDWVRTLRICPHCGVVLWIDVHTGHYHWYTCGNCHGGFYA